MSTRVRRPPDGPSRAPSHPGPSAPPRTRRLKKRHHTGLIVLALIIGSSIYASNRSHHDHPSPIQHDRADLSLVPGAVSVPAGGTGNVNIRLRNAGPDNLAHTVTFTITTSDRLAITGPGRVADNGLDDPFAPDADCKISSGGRLMRCEAFVTVSVGQQVVWTVPVRVTAGAPLGASETLIVTAVGNSLDTDSNASNNRDIAYPAVVGRPGAHEPVPSMPAPSTPPSSAVPSSTATKSHPPAGQRVRNAARDAVGPVSVVVGIVLGLALLIVIALALVARRQRKQPVSYIPRRRL